MIARNEAASLPRAVESAQRFADEIILVDTGSTDDTVKIAKKLGVHVHRFMWIHDFAAARNFSFSLCHHEYIWWQDPDEEVPAEDAPKIRVMAEAGLRQDIDEFVLPTFLNGTYRPPERDLPGYGPGCVVMKPRLVRRGRLSWRWNIHEDLYGKGDLRRATDETIRVFNHGDANKTDPEYYHALMVIGGRDHPGEPHYLLYLAEYCLLHHIEPHKALKLLDQIDQKKLAGGEQVEKFWLFTGQSWKTLAIFAHDRGMETEAIQAADNAVKAYGRTNGVRGPLQAASLLLFLGQRDTFVDITDEIIRSRPEELMARKFRVLYEAYPDAAELNEKVGAFLGALRGGATDMDQALEMAMAGETTVEGLVAEPWDEEKETRQIVVVIVYRCPPEVPERRRNLNACIDALACQDVNGVMWKVVFVCQDTEGPNSTQWNCLSIGGGMVYREFFDRSYEPFNRGRAFNFGVSHAGVSGDDLVCLMDADMLVDPGWLRRCLTAMSSRAMLPYDRAIYMDEESTEAAIAKGTRGSDITGDQWHSQGGCIWITAELYEEMGGHDERYVGWGSADRDFYLRLVQALGGQPQRMSQPLYHMNHPEPDESQKAANAKLFEDSHPDTTEGEAAKQ